MIQKYLWLLSLLTVSMGFGQSISNVNIQTHLKILAGDEFEGRETGKAGGEKAAAYLVDEFKKLKLQPFGDKKSYRQVFSFKTGIHETGEEGKTQNIIGFLDNHAKYTIIIGAHYDHLGLGKNGNSLDTNPQNKIHNGADDNASGVVGVLELARYFTKNPIIENNNFLFICFSGEELGLYGSKYWTEHPTIELDKINYMINLDMIGRYEPARGLSVSGSGTSHAWEPLLKVLSNDKLLIKTDSSGTGPSDHTSFYLKNIPVLHFFTGSHEDYHKPSDDWEKINFQGEADILDLIITLVNHKSTQEKLAFLPTRNKSMAVRSAFKVTLGIMPSYTSDETGLRVDGVIEGKPAQKAGILAGDLIVQLGTFTIKDIQTYMDALNKFEKGQTVEVKVKRKENNITLNITF